MAAEQARKARTSRNVELAHGLMKYSRSKMYRKRGLWAIKAKHGGVYPRLDPKPKTQGPSAERASKFYPADDSKKPLPKKRKITPCKLRASITPGTVLIILAGRFKGKRVVFLKQLPSGLLLITGPFKWNGVPLRRVNQAYVIATSTEVSVTGVDVERFDDGYFTKKAVKRKRRTEEQFFGGDADEVMKKEQSSISPERKEDQKSVDAPLMKTAELEPHLRQYLSSRFTLTGGLKPHELIF